MFCAHCGFNRHHHKRCSGFGPSEFAMMQQYPPAVMAALPHGGSQRGSTAFDETLFRADIVIREANIWGKAAQVFKAIATKDATVLRSLKVEKMRSRPEEWRKKAVRVLTTLSKSEAYRINTRDTG
ncbi:MAG: hypothetical protein HPY90_14780 [Syntrophothermus sp.]|uniref:hypothetical protein n=1 Tax=Syntrophothermus sp. TaxID=2736299 RepID=UPI00257F9B16|nr:hypothetical protein [Syntrophothermus sp.]NSW84485.1 hypothetical protein [Syntrophothermus sp.]